MTATLILSSCTSPSQQKRQTAADLEQDRNKIKQVFTTRLHLHVSDAASEFLGPFRTFHIDRIRSRKHGGNDDASNLALACERTHGGRIYTCSFGLRRFIGQSNRTCRRHPVKAQCLVEGLFEEGKV